MADLTLVRTRIVEGIWEGRFTGAAEAPAVRVTHDGRTLDGATVAADGADWLIRVPIPPETIGEGVQTYLLSDAATGERIESFTLIAGEALADDIRAEMDLLRAELDLLKRAFRRHCVETAGA